MLGRIGHGRCSAAARRQGAAWVILLAMMHAGPAWAEAGERFAPEPPARVAMPAAVADDGPSVGVIAVRRDPLGMEAARGARRAEALAKPRRVEKPAPPAKQPQPPAAQPAAEPSPAPSLIAQANAAEFGRGQASPHAIVWRRWLGSPYAAWIAAVVLIGIPLAGALRRATTGWRESRDLAGYD